MLDPVVTIERNQRSRCVGLSDHGGRNTQLSWEQEAKATSSDRSAVHVDAAPHPSARAAIFPLRPVDVELLSRWHASLRSKGWTPSAAIQAVRHLRSFARRTPNGLLRASKHDVVAFHENRERLLVGRQRRASQPETTLLSHPTWTVFVHAAKNFYAWAERQGLVHPARNPTRGLAGEARRRVHVVAQPRWYDRLLYHAPLDTRETALLWLLAHGLGTSEVMRLRPRDVCLEPTCHVRVSSPKRTRVVPLGDRAIQRLRPWVAAKQRFGSRWLFPAYRGRHISDRTVRHLVASVASRVFPDRPLVRQRIHAGGFRTVFITRALRRRLPLDAVKALTGLSRARLLDAYLGEPVPVHRLRREFRRMTRRWRNWL
jgi:site-specific recombinase XerD